MVYCPFAQGQCRGRANCLIWIKGRLLNTDSKLIATKLAQFLLNTKAQTHSGSFNPIVADTFWKKQGIPNIRQEILRDRYLKAKVSEVETLAKQWLKSSSFFNPKSKKNK